MKKVIIPLGLGLMFSANITNAQTGAALFEPDKYEIRASDNDASSLKTVSNLNIRITDALFG